MMVWRLIWRSLANRRATALLTVLAVAASVALLLVVEKVRTGARESFADTISGTDLIMGARAGDVQLLLYSVFRIGNATANVTWQSYQDIAARPEVAWIVPISLGDSHRGFRVLGTENGYFEHYRYRRGQQLQFAAGGPLGDLFDAVLGAEVAEQLGYKVLVSEGTPIVLKIIVSGHVDAIVGVACLNVLEKAFDKVLLAGAEQRLYDTAHDLLPGVLELDETPWRPEYLYSRAATIYGGTAEIQRNIIARRLLDLGKE